MKTNRNYLLLVFCSLLFTTISAQSSEFATNEWEIDLGKRKNNIFSREIREFNLGSTVTSYNPIFFKVGEDGQWQKVGVTGKNILPYIPSTDFSQRHFKQFKNKKIASYWTLGVAMIFYSGWGVSSMDYAIKGYQGASAFIRPRSLGFLGGFIAGYVFGVSWNTQADLELFMALNGNEVKQEKQSVSFNMGILNNGGLGLQMAF